MLARSLNTNQRLILSAVSLNKTQTISSLLRQIEDKKNIPLSTLKLNSKILRELGLIEYGNGSVAMVTELGSFISNLSEIGSEKT